MGWSWWKRLRPINLLIVALTQLFFIYFVLFRHLSSDYYNLSSQFDLWLIVVVTLLVTASGYVINDIHDIEIDRINKPDRVVLNPERWMKVYKVLFLCAISLTVYLCIQHQAWWYLGILVLAWYALYTYSTKLKCVPLWGNLLVSLFSASVVIAVLGPYLEEIYQLSEDQLKEFLRPFVFYFLFAFLLSLIREIIKDMEDYEGDKSRTCNTLVVSIGDEKTKVFVLFFSIVFLLLLTCWLFLFGNEIPLFFVIYLLITVMLPMVALMVKLNSIRGEWPRKKEAYHQLSSWVKFIMIAGILALSMELFVS